MNDSATNVISREHITVLESVQILGMSVPAHPSLVVLLSAAAA